jgi:cyclophilin family peptidyl-prolyl cis-trans isomerase
MQMLDDPEVAVVVNALRSLQQIADTTCNHCGAAILRSLSHPHPYVRVTAASALVDRFAWTAADSATRRALTDSLARHLRDTDAATRGASAHALLAHGGKGPIDARMWLGDTSVVTRVAVLQGLGAIPPGEASPLLIERLAPTHPLLERMTAAEVLGQLHARESLQALRAGLADSSSLFVSACAGALAELGDSASVPQMVRAFAAHAEDADADARLSLRDALRALAGTRLADSLEAAHPARNAFPATYPVDFAEPPPETGAVIHTTAGDITWAFARQEAPQTVKNFVRLARRGYFDGDVVHRVVPNFVIQDGDPTGTGSGGPGYTIRCEYNQLRYDPGMVGMALSGKDTGGSQWFITHSPQHHLDGRYTIFARVTAGMDVVQRIVQGDRILKVDIVP